MNNKYYDMQYEVTIIDVKDADAWLRQCATQIKIGLLIGRKVTW